MQLKQSKKYNFCHKVAKLQNFSHFASLRLCGIFFMLYIFFVANKNIKIDYKIFIIGIIIKIATNSQILIF